MAGKRTSEMRWDKLDNTANLFPVIVSEEVSNVYRLSVTLKEDIEPELLQKALDRVLPFFDVFHSKMKKGFFWYYFETNKKPAPKVKQENEVPCHYINPYENNEYLFRVNYYKNRINLEVFHVLTDGNGALMFLKEITYQYLRYKYPELEKQVGNRLNAETSLDREDSYLKNYKKSAKKAYKTEKALIIKGEKFPYNSFGIIHGYLNLSQLKAAAKKYEVTVNQYLIGVLFFSIYKEYLNGQPCKQPISSVVPVNLRPYFDSNTTKNFFVVVSAVFRADRDDYTFEEVLKIVKDCLNEQINKESLEKLFSYNVSNEKNVVLRAVPLFIKNIAMKSIFLKSKKANTMAVTNLGLCKVDEAYKEYIEHFFMTLSMSKGQNLKGAVISYEDTCVFTFSSAIRETAIQKGFFKKLVSDGVEVAIESNGVYYE